MRVNWFGFAGGVFTFLLVVISWFAPWWILTVGDNLVAVNASPINTTLTFFGTSFMVPLITVLNIIAISVLLASAICLLVYSFKTEKPYAKTLLDFSYKKPLYILVAYLTGLLFVVFSLQYTFGMNLPLLGAGTLTLPTVYTANATITADIASSFQWPFLFSITTVTLCIAAKFYHPKTQSATLVDNAVSLPTLDADTVKV
jgi:hypothetical protein